MDNQNRKVIISKDVTFNENVVYKDIFEVDAKSEKKPTKKDQ